jgi:hypothetical protein
MRVERKDKMAEATTNNTANVSSGKGVKGGYIYSAPVGTALPADIDTKLDDAFKILGFISEDGITISVEEDSNDLVDMNGDVMDSTYSNRAETIKFTLAEIKAGTFKAEHGSLNVTDENGLITIKHNGDNHDSNSYVFELLLKEGRRWRMVVPNAKLSELGDLTISSSELCQREITLKCAVDTAGNTIYDYIKSTETEASA